MTAMSQLFQNSIAGDIRLDASDGTTLNFKAPGSSQQEQAGNMFDRRTSDQAAVLAFAGATSPDSSSFGALQPASSLTESKQAQPPLGLGDADISQKIPDGSTDIAQSCSALSHRRMLLRPREDSCSNIPSSTNYNPALYPGGEALYEKAKLWGVEQERKQCRFWLKTMCCNGPRAFPTDIKDCAEFMPTEPRCFTGGIYCCLGTQREPWPPWPLKATLRGLSCESLFYRPDDYRLPRDQW